MAYRIEKAREDDRQAIERMHKVCFARGAPYPVDTENSYWWLARTPEGAPAGFAGMTVSTTEGGAYLCRAGVIPAHRGQGLQKKLIEVRIKEAKKMGLNWIVTDTVEGNYRSANNLIGAGFRMFNPITPWGNEGNNYWRLEL